MRNIKLSYSYDGSRFFGLQRQPNKRTVQGDIEKILNVLTNETINLISSGRTDRGVHALHQVSNFLTSSELPIETIKHVLDRKLPKDILLLEAEETDNDFNSRFHAISREYLYKISWKRDPFSFKYCTFIKDEVEPLKFQEILTPLIGKHDFINFRLNDQIEKTTVREIYDIDVTKTDPFSIEVRIRANSFLRSQIRIIIGTALDIYFNKLKEDYIESMLSKPNENFKKKLAPPEGLYLSKIFY